MTTTNATTTNETMTTVMYAARLGLGLGLAALLAAGCAELDGAPGGDLAPEDSLELASAESATTISTYSRWDWVPNHGGTNQLRVIPNTDGRLALFSRTPGGTVRFSQQVAPNSGWTPLVSFEGFGSPDMEVVRELDGRLGALVLGAYDRAVYYRTQTSPGASTFTDWASLGAGTGGATDLEVGQHADGRVVVFLLGADRTIWSRAQLVPGGPFGSWEPHYGASTMMRVTSQGGRLALASYTTVGTFYVKEQLAPNGAFGGWSYAGPRALTDFDITRLPDGRLHLAYVSPSDAQQALRWLEQSPTGAWSAYADDGTGPHTSIELLEAPGAAPIALTTTAGGHARVIPYSIGPYSAAYDIAGLNLVDVAAGRNADGRLDVFGRTSSNALTQTWQHAPGLPGLWRPLPAAAPAIEALSATPSAPLPGSPVDVSWRLGTIPAGCTPTLDMADDSSVFYRVAGLTTGIAHDSAITRDTSYTATASCAELVNSGVVRTTVLSLLVRVGGS